MDIDTAEIVEWLRKIESVLEKFVESIHHAQARYYQEKNKAIAVEAVVRQPEGIERNNTTSQEKAQLTQAAIAVAAWAAFVAALAYAVIAQLQLGTMRDQTAAVYHQFEIENANASGQNAQLFRQLNIAQQQAKAAQKSVDVVSGQLDLQRLQMVSQGDAEVRVDSISIFHSEDNTRPGWLQAGFIPTNRGHLIASQVRVFAAIGFQKPKWKASPAIGEPCSSDSIMPDRNDVTCSVAASIQLFKGYPAAALKADDIYVWGKFTYKGVNASVWFFCYYVPKDVITASVAGYRQDGKIYGASINGDTMKACYPRQQEE